MTEHMNVPDVRKSVIVAIGAEDAFRVFVEEPLGWWPENHAFVEDRRSLTIEPRVGGRYYEQGANGTEVAWGTIVEWTPPRRIVMTWRVGADWRPVFDDERASFIEVDFRPAGSGHTEVALTHSRLHRHGEAAARIHAALDGPSPGDTLAKYADLVAKHHAG